MIHPENRPESRLEHESEWSTKSGLWYMPILMWDDPSGISGKLLTFTGLSLFGTPYEEPFVLSYN